MYDGALEEAFSKLGFDSIKYRLAGINYSENSLKLQALPSSLALWLHVRERGKKCLPCCRLKASKLENDAIFLKGKGLQRSQF